MRDRNVLKNPELRELLDIAEKNVIKDKLHVEMNNIKQAIGRAKIDTFEESLLEISNKLQSVLADVIEIQNYFKGE